MSLFDEITNKNTNQIKKRDDEEQKSSMSLFDEITSGQKSSMSLFDEITSGQNTSDDNFSTFDTKSTFDTSEKKIGSTIGYTSGKVATGATSVFEGIADAGAWVLKRLGILTSWMVDNPVGAFVFGEDAGDFENNPLYQIGNDMVKTEMVKEIDTALDKSKAAEQSYVEPGSLGANIASGVGQVGGMVLTGKIFPAGKVSTVAKNATKAQKILNTAKIAITNPTTKSMFLSTFGNSYSQASNSGANDLDASVYGLLNAAKETGTEMIYGGLGAAFGKGALDDVAKEGIEKLIFSKLGETVKAKLLAKTSQLGISMFAEGMEEVFATLLDPFVESVYTHKLDFSAYDSILNDFITGALVSGVLQTPGTIVDLKSKNPQEVIQQLQKDNYQSKLDTIAAQTEQIINNKQVDNKTKIDRINNQIDILNDQLTEFVPVGVIDIEGIHKQKTELIKKRDAILSKTTEQQKVQVINELNTQVADVLNTSEGTLDSAVIESTEDKIQQIEKLTKEVEKDKLIKVLSNKEKVKSNAQQYSNEAAAIIEQMNINIPEGQKRIVIVTELNQEQRQIMDIGSIFGKQVVFTENMPQSGLVNQNNPDILFIDNKATSQLITNKQGAMLYVMGHELYHSLKQTNAKTYNQFTEYVKQEATIEQIVDFVGKYDSNNVNQLLDSLKIDGEFNLEEIKNNPLKYESQNTALNNIIEEMTANEFGGMITDKQYMNNLYNANRSLFERIINSIRELFKSLSGSVYDSSLTQLQVEKIRNDFENIISEIQTEIKSKTEKTFNTDDKYVYHIDYTNSSYESFAKNGIKPSKRGIAGQGVYMANTEDNTVYNVDDISQGTMYRINKEELIKKYDTYNNKTKSGLTFDETTGEIILLGRENISPDLLEVKLPNGEWKKLTDISETQVQEKLDYVKIAKTKQIWHRTSSLEEILKSGILEDDTSLAIQNKEDTFKSAYKGNQFIFFKPNVLEYRNNDRMYKGDGGRAKIKEGVISRENPNKFATIQELLDTELNKPYFEVKTQGEVNIKNVIDRVEIPADSKQSLIDLLEKLNIPYEITGQIQEEVKTTKIDLDKRYEFITKNLDKYNKELDRKSKQSILDTTIKAYENYKKDGGTQVNDTLEKFIQEKPVETQVKTTAEDFRANLKIASEVSKTKELPRSQEQQRESKFYSNTAQNSELFNDILSVAKNNPQLRNYTTTSHDADMQKAMDKIKIEGGAAINNFFDSNRLDSVDTAMAKVLLEYYKGKNDVQSEITVYNKLRIEATKSGQFVESLKVFKDISPASVVQSVQNDLNRAFDELQNSNNPTIQTWLRENINNARLTDAEREWIYQMSNKASKLEFDSPEYRRLYAMINSFVANRIPKTFGTKLKSFRRMAMLFNPKTQVRNIMGNVLMVGPNIVSDAVGTFADKVLAKKSGVRTQDFIDIKQSVAGFKEGVKEATLDRKQEINTSRTNPYEIQQGRTWKNKGTGKVLNWMEKWDNYFLNLGDRPFEEMAYYNSLNNQMKANNVTEATETMKQIAQQEAEKKTWKNNGKMVQFASSVRRIFNHIGFKDGTFGYTETSADFGIGDMILPFIMTPANLAVATYDYSPAAIISVAKNAKAFTNSLKTGKNVAFTQKAFVDSFGKAVTGTLFYAIAFALAKAGLISGGEDEDKDIRALMRAQGYQPYSIKIGNTTFSYDWAQPIANPFATMAELERQTQMNKNNPNKSDEANNAFKAITEAFTIGGNRLYEQSFLQSLKALFSAETPKEGIINFVTDLPQSFVPTLLKQIADLTDKNVKATYDKNNLLSTMFAKTMAKIPGLKSLLPTRKNILGDDMQLYGGANNIFNVMFNPANVSKDLAGDIGTEIMDVYNHTGENGVMPQVAIKYIDYDTNADGVKERITFDNAQQATLQEYMGTTMANAMNEMLNNDVYQNASYEDKATALISLMQYSKAVALRDTGLVANYEIKSGNAAQINSYVNKGLSIPNAVMYDSLINQIQGYKDSNGDSVKGSENGQKAYAIMNMQTDDNSKNIMLKLISPTANTPETVDSLANLGTTQQFIDYYSLPRRDVFLMDKFSRDDYDISTTYFNIAGNTHMEFAGTVSQIKPDYDKKGNPIPNSKKNKVFQYINSLPLNQYQKIYLFSVSGYSISQWKSQMFNYVNNMNITANEKKTIWSSLGFE